jgi:hypothetical protein
MTKWVELVNGLDAAIAAARANDYAAWEPAFEAAVFEVCAEYEDQGLDADEMGLTYWFQQAEDQAESVELGHPDDAVNCWKYAAESLVVARAIVSYQVHD